MGVPGPVGPRPRRRSDGHRRVDRLSGRAPPDVSGHARLPLQPYGTLRPRAPHRGPRGGRGGIGRVGRDRFLRRPRTQWSATRCRSAPSPTDSRTSSGSPATSGATISIRGRQRSSSTSSTWPTTMGPISTGSPPTTLTTFGRHWLCGTGWSPYDRRTSSGGPPGWRLKRSIPSSMPRWRPCTAYGPETPEHLLGDLLGYWWRELRPTWPGNWPRLLADIPVLLDDPEVIAGLSYRGPVERIGKKGKPLKWGGVRFEFPTRLSRPSMTDRSLGVLYATPDGAAGYADVDHIDAESQQLVLIWNQRSQDLGIRPFGGRLQRLGATGAQTGGARRAGRARCSIRTAARRTAGPWPCCDESPPVRSRSRTRRRHILPTTSSPSSTGCRISITAMWPSRGHPVRGRPSGALTSSMN